MHGEGEHRLWTWTRPWTRQTEAEREREGQRTKPIMYAQANAKNYARRPNERPGATAGSEE